MTDINAVQQDLRAHLRLAGQLLVLADEEAGALRDDPAAGGAFNVCQERKKLLPELEASLERLRQHRAEWQKLSPAERAALPEVASLLTQNQELIMKVLNRDRENEQQLLRRGLVPARHHPPAARQRPHFVADLYRRHVQSTNEPPA